MKRTHWHVIVTLWLGGLVGLPAAALACPFCNAVQKTLSEDIAASVAVVVAKLVDTPAKPADATTPPDSVFEIVRVLKGGELLKGAKQVKTLYFGGQPKGTQFLIYAVDPERITWSAPTALSARAVGYVSELPKLPEKGVGRLEFFQEYLEDADGMLANDAYDEFARAPYAEVRELREKMHHDQLLAWVTNTEVSASRRRLYLTMLGVCGRADDVPALEAMIKSKDRQVRSALDALIACYLTLKGPDGVSLVEDLFLKNKDAEYTDTYAAIMAFRFLGQESDVVPRQRLMEGLRYMLERPPLADLVIPDLARWQDWSVMEKLVKLFKEADEDSSWVRVPVVNYLRACPKPEAKEYLKELTTIDPESVKRAMSFSALGAVPAPAAGGDKSAGKDATAKDSPPKEKPATAKPAPPKAKPAAATKPAAGKKPAAIDGAQAGATDAEAAGDELALAPVELSGKTSQATMTLAPANPSPADHETERSVTPPAADGDSGEISGLWLLAVASAAGGVVMLLLLAIFRGNRGTVVA